MRVPWADLILGVIGTVKSRDYKLWWSTVKHPSSSPFTYIHREVCSQWQGWDGSWPGELSQTLVLQAGIPALHLCKLSSLSMGFMAREFHEVQWILDLAQLFPKIGLCQRHKHYRVLLAKSRRSPYTDAFMTLQRLPPSTQHSTWKIQKIQISCGVASFHPWA